MLRPDRRGHRLSGSAGGWPRCRDPGVDRGVAAGSILSLLSRPVLWRPPAGSSSSAAAPGPRSSDSRPARNQAVHARGERVWQPRSQPTTPSVRAVPRQGIFAETIVAVFGTTLAQSALIVEVDALRAMCNSTLGKVRGGRGGLPPLISGLGHPILRNGFAPHRVRSPGRSGRT